MSTVESLAAQVVESFGQEHLLTPDQVAEILSVTEHWVRQKAREGEIPAIKLGRYWRFSRSAIEAWLTDRQSSTYKRRSG